MPRAGKVMVWIVFGVGGGRAGGSSGAGEVDLGSNSAHWGPIPIFPAQYNMPPASLQTFVRKIDGLSLRTSIGDQATYKRVGL